MSKWSKPSLSGIKVDFFDTISKIKILKSNDTFFIEDRTIHVGRNVEVYWKRFDRGGSELSNLLFEHKIRVISTNSIWQQDSYSKTGLSNYTLIGSKHKCDFRGVHIPGWVSDLQSGIIITTLSCFHWLYERPYNVVGICCSVGAHCNVHKLGSVFVGVFA